MSRILEQFPARLTRQPLYPWDEWTDGQIRALYAGTDFTCQPISMQQRCQREGKARGLQARTRILKADGEHKVDRVVIQFLPKESKGGQDAPKARGRRRRT